MPFPVIEFIKKYLLPKPEWWFNMPYGKGIEGFVRQHVPAHVGQGFILYWYFYLGTKWLLDAILEWSRRFVPFAFEYATPIAVPWLVPAWGSLGMCIGWELIQRERWRRDKGGNVMPWTENIWDVILGAGGIALAVSLHLLLH